jgi:hypothetical protein
MKTYFFKRLDGTTIVISADQMFWNGIAAVFVQGQTGVAVVAIQSGEFIIEQSAGRVVPANEETGQKKPVN